MANVYKAPGVYVEEIQTLPASIAEVETAIPAFVGYTQLIMRNGESIRNKPIRITSMMEYVEYFGTGPDHLQIVVDLDNSNSVKNIKVGVGDPAGTVRNYHLYNSLRMFFANGGGPCYIVSVGTYQDEIDKLDLQDGIDQLNQEDEPTLLAFPDAVELSVELLGDVQKAALDHCSKLKDRFCIFDMKQQTDSVADAVAFRDNIGVKNLSYGAAYYPYLNTTLGIEFSFENIRDGIRRNGTRVSLMDLSAEPAYASHLSKIIDDKIAYGNFYKELGTLGVTLLPASLAADNDTTSRIKTASLAKGFDLITDAQKDKKAELEWKAGYLRYMLEGFISLQSKLTDDTDEDNNDATEASTLKKIHKKRIAPGEASVPTQIEQFIQKLYTYDSKYPKIGTGEGAAVPLGVVAAANNSIKLGDEKYNLKASDIDVPNVYGTASTELDAVTNARPAFQQLYDEILRYITDFSSQITFRVDKLEKLLRDTNPIYAKIVAAAKKQGVILPPSGAVAGVYASTDNDRGVWKAPANVSLNVVASPVVKITAKEQENLNVDVNAGKSINVVRSFTGKGTLVWGARTLAGNDNEWRYIPVRRLFIMVEESVKKATEAVVFEPNTKNTWVRTQAMIENYLNSIWRAGGLAGAKPEQAYFVNIGLGKTMSPQDILEGRMIIEVGMAAVRPAEFIVLKFMHKLQEA